ncbi:MAG: AsmA family protein [Alphaproteobacteria bacterium]|nr:AsmA family protein [Alphaproteobacteria bacterium]
MKKVFIALAVLGVLLVAAVLVGPSFIDWNAYKGQIVAQVRDNTGRDASIDGDIAFSVLPTPALRVAGVRIANFEGAQSADMLRLKELRVRVSIAALLERRIVVEQLELIEPVIALEIAEDGRASWDIKTAAAASESEAAPAQEEAEAGAPLDISLANVMIRNGSLSFRDAKSGTVEKIDALEMSVSAPSLSGPFELNAKARVRGTPVSIELKTGALKPEQPLTVGLKLALTDADAEVRFNGRMLAPIPTGLLSGSLEIEGADAARLAALAVKDPLPAVLAQPVSLKGTMMVSPDAVALNDTAIRLGAFAGNGAVSVTLGETVNADIAVSVSRLNLDELLTQSADAKAMPAETTPSSKKVESATPATPAAPSNSKPFALPNNINASFDFGIDVIQYRNGVIRDVGVRAALANGTITLDRASALLPGGSDVSLVGFLSFVEGDPSFEGEIAAASDNLRGLLGWAGADTQSLPPDRMRGFSYASKIKATPTAIEIPDINVRLDASTMTGGLAVAVRDRPGFGLRLAIDQLNLDAYMPRTAAKPAVSRGKQKVSASAPAGKKPVEAAPLAFLDSFDANIDVQIERLTVHKTVARKIHFDGLLVGGALTVRKAGVRNFAGTRADLSGDVKNLAGAPSAKIDYRVTVSDPEKLFQVVGAPLPIPRQKLGKPSMEGRIEGGADAFTVKSKLVAAGTKVQLDGMVKSAATAPAFDIKATVNHPELVEFVRLASPDFRPAAKALGPLAASFRLEGVPTNLRISALDASVGPLKVEGNVAFRTDGPRPFVSADLATSEVLLDLFQPAPKKTGAATARGRAAASANDAAPARSNDRWSREPIDLTGLSNVDADIKIRMTGLISDRIRLAQPELSAALKNGKLDLRQFKAGLFGGSVSAKGSMNAGAKVPALSADITASNVDLATASKAFGAQARVAGPVSATASLTTTGKSVAAFVSTLAGTGTIAGKVQILATKQEQQAIGAIGLATAIFGDKVKELKQVGGLTNELVQAFGRSPADLSGNFTIDRGVVQTGDTVLNGAGTRAVTVGAADLPRWLVNSTTSVLRKEDDTRSPYISVTLTGALDSPNIKTGGSFLSARSNSSSSSSSPLQQILPGVLGKPSESDNSGSGKVEPKDILRDLLKGFGK